MNTTIMMCCLTNDQHSIIIVLVAIPKGQHMIPSFQSDDNLPPGIYQVNWQEFESRFGWNSHRRALLAGLRLGLNVLKAAGSKTAHIDGSFVTAKDYPGDFDCCWDPNGVDGNVLVLRAPELLDLRPPRAAQKARFGGEFFPSDADPTGNGDTYLRFFQIDKAGGSTRE